MQLCPAPHLPALSVREWGSKFCAARGSGICQPRATPKLLTHMVSYRNITTQRTLLEKQANWPICQGQEKIVKGCNGIFTRDDVVSLRLKIRQRIPFVFLGVKLPCFFNFPICRAHHEKIVIFIGCNFESRGSQVGLHKRNQRYCVSKEGKSELTGFLIYSQKARMSRIYYLRSRSSLGCFAAKKECSAG